jgi:hypothetical protein
MKRSGPISEHCRGVLVENTEQSTGNQEINDNKRSLELDTYRRQVREMLGR